MKPVCLAKPFAEEPPDETAQIEAKAKQRIGDEERVRLRGEKDSVTVDASRPRTEACTRFDDLKSKGKISPRQIAQTRRTGRVAQRAAPPVRRCDRVNASCAAASSYTPSASSCATAARLECRQSGP